MSAQPTAPSNSKKKQKLILIGSGIMSANLAALLRHIQPELQITLFEATKAAAQEASNGWNNAGTGHAGLCELSYTPEARDDGSVDPSNPIHIFEQFEHSRQFWSYATQQGIIDNPQDCIRPVPHISFVHGQKQVNFLRERHRAMSAHHFFADMQYSEDPEQIHQWAPLLTEGRDPNQPIAATRAADGTDVNFGNIARSLLNWFEQQPHSHIHLHHKVIGLTRLVDGWVVKVKNLDTGAISRHSADFVFVGAGGGTLPLLQQANIPEAKGLGGFPVGGGWLVCNNPEIIKRHHAKVYGQAQEEAPTMAVPHLDSRQLGGEQQLLFGPFAAFTTKFLHRSGSHTDLPSSIRFDNISTLTKIGIHNLPLVQYLIREGTQSLDDRIEVLRRFFPAANKQDWHYQEAGIRVQAIKKTDGEAGIVHYGTEVISSADKTLSALLGASPGASVSVNIILNVIRECLSEHLQDPQVRERLSQAIPSWDHDLKQADAAEHYQQLHQQNQQRFGFSDPTSK